MIVNKSESFMRFSILLCLFLFSFSDIYAQKLLQMDINKFGGKISFDVGDVLEFQVDNKKEWYKFQINGFDYDKQEIIFDELSIPISRITKISYIKKNVRRTTIWLGSIVAGFGIPWTTYAVYGLIIGSPMVVPATFVVGAVAISLAAILLSVKFFWKRKYIISEKRRLRIVDLTIYPNKASILPKENKKTQRTNPKGFCSERETRTLDLSIMSAAL